MRVFEKSMGARWSWALLSLSVFGAGCTPEQDSGSARAPSAPKPPELRQALVRLTAKQAPREVTYEVVNGKAIAEGDIVLGTVEQVERESASLRARARGEVSAQGLVVEDRGKLWPNNTVYYSYSENFVNPSRIEGAIAHWRQRTALRFSRVSYWDSSMFSAHIRFVPGSGCSSAVGRTGIRQEIELADACDTQNVIHELGHAIGLWHEQCRSDRDNFVNIDWDNIESSKRFAFDKHISDGEDHGPYDYNSIMHYYSWAFAIDSSKPTITRKDGSLIFDSTQLSPGDVAAVADLYPGQVVGSLDRITSTGVVEGWTFDTDRPDQSIEVHCYVDGPWPEGRGCGSFPTDVHRQDVKDRYGGIVGVHGFRFNIPPQLRDGQPHTLYLYGIDVQGRRNELLSGSGMGFTFGGALGQVEHVQSNGTVTGWALDHDSPSTSIAIHYYIDGAYVGAQPTNIYRSDINGRYPGTWGNHGFTFRIPEYYFDGLEHRLDVYAIDAQNVHNPLLVGSPYRFTLNVPTVNLSGDFMGLGYPQMLTLAGGGTGNRVLIRDYKALYYRPTLRYVENWGDSGLLNGWHGGGDIQLAGDFMGLGYDQVMFINTQPGGGRVMIVDFKDGVVPGEVRYHQAWGASGLLDGWHDPGDLQLVGDFRGEGYDQVMFVNRSGTHGRAMLVGHRGGGQGVLYHESWDGSYGDWTQSSRKLFVGDFLGTGREQILAYSTAGGPPVEILELGDNMAPLDRPYIEDWSGSFLAPFAQPNDVQVAGDFTGRGYEQLLVVNNSESGARFSVADFRDRVAPAETRYWENWGDSSVLNYMHFDYDGRWGGDFRGLGYDQVLFGRFGGLGGAVKIGSFRDGVAPAEILFDQIVMN